MQRRSKAVIDQAAARAASQAALASQGISTGVGNTRPATPATPRSGGVGVAGSPRAVIRGESTLVKGAIVDYLRFSFLPAQSIHDTLAQLQRYMRIWFPIPVTFVASDKGMFSYDSSYDVMCWANGEVIRIAIILIGGEKVDNTMLVDMSGLGCSIVEDWQAVYATLQDLDARITRADTALDLFQGFTVEQFDDMYFAGDFNAGGRIPTRRMVESGDANTPDCYGRTLYLGKKQNGKELCIYQKGKQLGKQDSEWIRIEVRFGNRDRVIPHDFVLNPTKYFAGAFVALQALIDEQGEKIYTDKQHLVEEEHDLTMSRLLHYMKISYGKLVHQYKLDPKFSAVEFIDAISIEGVPRKMQKAVAGVVAGDAAFKHWTDNVENKNV